MQAPSFWQTKNWQSYVLMPLTWLYQLGYRLRCALTISPQDEAVPVLCVGNVVIGGAGKTPTVAALADMLKAMGHVPHVVTRGYGGSLEGPVNVDVTKHHAAQVGDEALVLAKKAPVWVSKERVLAVKEAISAGCDVILLDDGLQNPRIPYKYAVLVLDGAYGLGNGACFPSGPLREPLAHALRKVQAVVIMGEDKMAIAARLPQDMPVFHACIQPEPLAVETYRGKKVLGFAGIGRPDKFLVTLKEIGYEVMGFRGFPDHYRYPDNVLKSLVSEAEQQGALALTTEKDWVRFTPEWQKKIAYLPVSVQWDAPEKVQAWLEKHCTDSVG